MGQDGTVSQQAHTQRQTDRQTDTSCQQDKKTGDPSPPTGPTHIHVRLHTHSHARAHTHTHTHAHTHTHTHTHTHRQTERDGGGERTNSKYWSDRTRYRRYVPNPTVAKKVT